MKRISATQIENGWAIVVESPAGDPITRRDLNHMQRALTLKLRTYYIEQRRISLARAEAERIRLEKLSIEKVATGAKVNVTSEQKVTIVEMKGKFNG